MQNVRVVSTIAAAIAVAFVAVAAPASETQSMSYTQPGLDRLIGGVPVGSDVGPWFPAVPDPQNVWVAGAPIPQGLVRYAHAQCLGSNSFYVFTGVAPGGAITNASRRYDAATNTWAAPLAPFPGTGSEGPSGVCYQGKIYVVGGSNSLTALNIYDIATNTWSTGAALPRPVWGPAMGAHAGRIYMIGGDPDFFFGGTSNVVSIYDIATNTWLPNGLNMPSAAVTAGFAQIGTFLYIVGGWGDASPASNVNVTQRYDMATNTWTTGPAFTAARADLPLAASATALYAIGGDTNGGGPFDASAVVERLDLSTWPAGAWAPVTSLPEGRTGHKGGFCTQTFIPAAGEVWSTGGLSPGFVFTTTNQYQQSEACPSAANAVTIAVDTAGNGVLETGEAAVVAPTWLNPGGVAIPNLTGTASNFTGPAGPTYTIDDPTANYGTVAAGAQATCSTGGDCYGVTITGTRPVAHWDASLTETLSIGAIKDWTLHVGGSFTDVSTTGTFYRFIETLLHNGVTGGCGADTYCPTSSTTREQMAVFVLVAKEGAGYTPVACAPPNLFGDVPDTSPFCRFIEELANRQVVTGCGPNLYCPSDAVTREQMAIFVLRTLDPALNPPVCVAGSEMFTDVPATSVFCRWIEELARRGVVTGCGPNVYCPSDPVTREQMGVFLSATFGLTLYSAE